MLRSAGTGCHWGVNRYVLAALTLVCACASSRQAARADVPRYQPSTAPQCLAAASYEYSECLEEARRVSGWRAVVVGMTYGIASTGVESNREECRDGLLAYQAACAALPR